MNYIQPIEKRLAELLPDCASEPELIRLYALLVLVKGGWVSLEDVHNAWAVWRNLTRPDHPDLIPFVGLARDVQALDQKYADAIRKVAQDRSTCPECEHSEMMHMQHDGTYGSRYGCFQDDCSCPLQPATILAGGAR